MTSSEFREDLDTYKTRMNGLSCGAESMTICSAVLIQCQRVTDGLTDVRTDVQPISIICFSIADARKIVCVLVFRTLVWPIATCACESWTLRKGDEAHVTVRAFEMKSLRLFESVMDT